MLAAEFLGLVVVEIGTHRGDGMNCFARVAKVATAIEMEQTACQPLKARARELVASRAGSYSVLCQKYQLGVPDADAYTWWKEAPGLGNLPTLRELRSWQLRGLIRRGARAYVLFDLKWPSDVKSLEAVRPLSEWTRIVNFDERSLCVKMRGPSCHRSYGQFVVARVALDAVNTSQPCEKPCI